MKLSDIENVKKASAMLTRLDLNIIKINNLQQLEMKPDSGGIKGIFEYGYRCNVGQFSDGSGAHSLDLHGCYVGEQVYQATLQILINQRQNVVTYLESIGVTYDSE